MKTAYFLLFGLIVSFASYSQNDRFEGSITFGFEYKGENINQYASYLQSESVYYFKGNDVRFKMVGGMAAMMGETLIDGDTKTTYQVNDLTKTAYITSQGDDDTDIEKGTDGLTITSTNEVEEIIGYKCLKYKVEDATEGATFYIWMTTELNLINPEEFGGAAAGLFFPGTKGAMLKMEASMDMEGTPLSIIQTVKEIKVGPQDASLFTIPADYSIEDFDPSKMMGVPTGY